MNKDSLIKYGLGFLLILAIIFGIYQLFQARKFEKLSTTYKKEMIESDSLRQVNPGQYQKLVNDLNSQKDLLKQLKMQNEDLYSEIKKQKKKPVVTTHIEQSFESKSDTIYVVEKSGSFTDYYPGKDEWFIKYRSEQLNDSLRVGDWDFSTLDVDLVISEKQKGIFEADLKGPDFLKVNNLQVNSLPLENIKKDKFGWLLGGGVNYTPTSSDVSLEVSAGVRLNKTNIVIKGTTDQQIGFGIIKEF